MKKIKTKEPIKKQTNITANTKETGQEVARLIKIIVGIVVVFALFCVITYFVTKDKKETNYFPDLPTEIQYSKIMLGTMLKLKEKEYYVIVTKEEDPDASLYGTYLNLYQVKEKALPVYTANLDDVLNRPFQDTTSHLNVKNLKDLKIKEATLFHIKDHKIVKTYEGKDKIVKQFEQLVA